MTKRFDVNLLPTFINSILDIFFSVSLLLPSPSLTTRGVQMTLIDSDPLEET